MIDGADNPDTYPTLEEESKMNNHTTLQQQENQTQAEEAPTLQDQPESNRSDDPLIEDLPDLPIKNNIKDKLLSETEILEKQDLIESKLGINKIQFPKFCKISQITQNFLIPTAISNKKEENSTILKFRKSILLTPLEESAVLLTTENNLPTSLEETTFIPAKHVETL